MRHALSQYRIACRRLLAAGLVMSLMISGCRSEAQVDPEAGDQNDERTMPLPPDDTDGERVSEVAPSFEPVRLPSPVPPPVTRSEQRPLPSIGQAKPVKEGTAPLVYMVETDARVRVVNVESGETIATVTVEAPAPLAINERRGVRVGTRQILAGPLPPGRRYAIYLETDAQGYYRTGITEPGIQNSSQRPNENGETPDP
jgi:hypothetical protein